MKNLFLLLIASFFSTSLSHKAFAVEPKTFDELPVLYQQAFQLSATHEKNALELLLEAKNGYHIYKDNFKVESENYNLKMRKESQAFKGIDPVTKKLKEFYQNQNIFLFDTTIKTDGPAEIKNLIVSLQACSRENCLLPVKLSIPIKQLPAMMAAPEPDKPLDLELSTEAGLAGKIRQIFKSSGGVLSLQALLILLFAGIITAISPCVLPLFPITLGIFSRWAHHDNKKAFGLTLSYAGGIILFFAANGLISAATGGLFGALTQNAYYLLGVGIITFIAGFIFSGLIPFPFANFLLKVAGKSDLNNVPQKYSKLLIKSFAMGATLGLVASPCVGPILLALLAWLSHELPNGDIRSYAAGLITLSVFGFGLSLPFLILGHFYFRLHKRVALGRFSAPAKYVGSLLLIASSFFFLVPAFKILNKSPEAPSHSKHSFSWENKPSGQWLVVDFRADWCAACIEIEKEVLSEKNVLEFMAANNWALVQVDMTVAETYEKLAQEYEIISLPSLIFKNPEGKECKAFRLHEKESPTNFLRRLKGAQENCR